ncbi:hypothetical protein K1719_044984 [Acacia pycnantha]|nr:hypothetical protein K1719_044984 [Acacia pycnantha]
MSLVTQTTTSPRRSSTRDHGAPSSSRIRRLLLNQAPKARRSTTSRRNNFNQGRRLNGRVHKAQREDNIRRTVYVFDIDQHVIDCRICGDTHSILRFAFVEFADERGARAALNLSGTVLGYYPVKVLPSKTAILPVNPTFLPRVRINCLLCP